MALVKFDRSDLPTLRKIKLMSYQDLHEMRKNKELPEPIPVAGDDFLYEVIEALMKRATK